MPMSRFFFVFVFFFSLVTLFAQKGNPNATLLWKISGNGLQKPSYLYGTMHVRDKRVFNFADSVLLKLDECEAFSLEIDPDSALEQLLSEQLASNDFKLKHYLGDEEYKQLQEELAEESGYDPSLLKSQNPFVLRNFVSPYGRYRNDMPTFLDAYLYNISRENGKKFVALENVKDQTEIIRNLPNIIAREVVKEELGINKSRNEKDLLSIYLAADLEELDRRSRSMSDTAYYIMFTRRNQSMCARIREYAPRHSTFFAMGAGHLPGKDGVISLLRKQGFVVTPITATYKGLAEKFKSKKLSVPWNTVNSPEEGYSVDMPSKLISSFSSNENLKACADAGTGLFYMSSSLMIPENVEMADEAGKIKNIIENYWKKQEMQILEQRAVTTSGKPVTEFLIKRSGYYFRTRLLFNGKYTYLLLVGGSLQGIGHNDANRFFNSLKFMPVKPQNWNLYTSLTGAFTVYFPGTPKETEVRMPVSGKGEVTTRMMLANDAVAGIQYLMQYFDGKGLIYPSDSAFFESGFNSLKENMEVDSVVVRKHELSGFPGIEGIIYGKNKTIMKTLTFLRGSRGYNLIALFPENRLSDPNLATFFNSFQMTEYQDSTWDKQTIFNSAVQVKFPAKPNLTSEKENYSALFDSTQQYLAHDKFSGTSFYFMKSYFNKYVSAPTYDSIFNQSLHSYINRGDSVVTKKTYSIGEMPVMDVSLRNKGSHNFRKIRIYLSDSAMYLAFSFLPVVYQDSRLNNKFFESIDFANKKRPSKLLLPKTDQLLNDLTSVDSAIHFGAAARIVHEPFNKSHLAAIYEALQKSYISDTLDYGSARSQLFRVLGEIADSGYMEYFKNHYDDFGKYPYFQVDALEVLAKLKTSGSRKLLFQYLLNKTPNAYNYSLFWKLRDSMELNKPYFPELLKLLANKEYSENVLSFTDDMLKKGYISATDLQPYFPQLLAEAEEQLKELKNYGKTEYFDESLVNILTRINTTASQSKLKLYLASSNVGVKMYAAIGLLKNDQNVKAKELEKIASFPGFRQQLYVELDTLGKKSMFPTKYYTQQYFAESDLWNYFAYEDEEPSKVELITIKDQMYKGEMKRFYCYKVIFEYEDEKSAYFGLSGPYPVNGKDVIISGDITGSTYSDFDGKTIDEHLKEYLEE